MPLRLLGIVKALTHDPNMLDAYIHAVEECPTFDVRLRLAKIPPSIEDLTVQQSNGLIAAFHENSQIRDC